MQTSAMMVCASWVAIEGANGNLTDNSKMLPAGWRCEEALSGCLVEKINFPGWRRIVHTKI